MKSADFLSGFMANPLRVKQADSNDRTVCNAESELGNVSKSVVLEVISRQRAAFEFLNVAGGLSPSSPHKFTRERHEIVAGKILALDSVAGLIRQIPPAAPPDLMGEKPTLPPFILDDLQDVRESVYQLRSFLAGLPGSSALGSPWDRATSTLHLVESILSRLSRLSGNAEEQPGPREESRPPIGTLPVTAVAANPSPSGFGDSCFPDCLPGFPDGELMPDGGLPSRSEDLDGFGEIVAESERPPGLSGLFDRDGVCLDLREMPLPYLEELAEMTADEKKRRDGDPSPISILGKPVFWIGTLPISELSELTETCLSEMESRGAVLHWSLTGF